MSCGTSWTSTSGGAVVYLRRLQESYDYGMHHFSKEYYDNLEALAYADRPPEWKVTIEDDFRAERGKAGKEITVGKQFAWGDELWHVRAVYLCSGGVVADFCIQLDDDWIRDYFRKAMEREEKNIRPTYEERVVLEREKSSFIAVRFVTPAVGGTVRFTHPISGVKHTLTVREIEDKTMDPSGFHDQNLEYPSHFMAMSYILDPDLPKDAFMIKECDGGNNPRPKNPHPYGRFSVSVGVVAMVRSADGPTSVFLADGSKAQTHAIASSMHFEPLTEPVEWHMIIREKLLSDLDVPLI